MGWFKRKAPKREADDDGPTFAPPSQEKVAYRALCLATIGLKGTIEHWITDQEETESGRQAKREHSQRLDAWARAEGLGRHFSPEEKRVLSIPIGKWPEQDLLDAHWRSEAFGVLAWSLSLIDRMPAWDRVIGVEFPEIHHVSGLLSPTKEFLWRVKLRPATDLAKMQVRAKAWNWRARTTRLIRENHPLPPQITWDELLKVSSHGHYEEGDTPPPIRDDFPVLNKAYRELTDGEYQEILSIAQERHFAMNWLCGYSEDWDSTPTGT